MGKRRHAVVVGGGVGGLAAALDLAASGWAVTVVEKEPAVGGKLRRLTPGAAGGIDAGPTVFTMRWVFERLFADTGAPLDAHVTLDRAEVLARHAWSDRERLDLFADTARSADAIGAFAGAAAARGYLAFCARARKVYRSLEQNFIAAPRPGLARLVASAGWRGLSDMRAASPFATLWDALAADFADLRLRQLFARYATYSGASPFQAPSILMLIAHVEQEGVWLVRGGMYALAEAMRDRLLALGGTLRCAAPCAAVTAKAGRATGVRLDSGEEIAADAVVVNADIAAVATNRLGQAAASGASGPAPAERSLSAVTWAVEAACDGFPLARHSVFFARDYAREFAAIFRDGRVGPDPTVYVCAQSRNDDGTQREPGPDRLLVLVNAPANGDRAAWDAAERERCRQAAWGVMARCGLRVTATAEQVTTPREFAALFPASGGALYGVALHGPMTAFRRMGSRGRLKGLYFAGGSVHPGPGVPMAALSGRLAAAALRADFAST